MNINAICSDIDGTLLDSQRGLSPRTIRTIRSLENNFPVILASARMPSAMRHLQDELGILHHPMICFNGGYVLLYNEGADTPDVVDSVQIPLATCFDIVAMAQGSAIHISLYTEDNWYVPQFDQWAEREELHTKVSPEVSSLQMTLENWQKADTGAHKVMCMGPEDEIAALADKLTHKLGDEIYIYRSKSTYLELAPRSISKATALEMILKANYGIAMPEVMAFGDNYNDIEMLRAVGKGIAVGNARPEVKAAADELTLKSTDDGVAVAIEKYLLQK
ncbi:Cof-type HAD-IIB family hydrolase [Pontibacter sp. E15-1]|uniref:Cof-type HAD-IIB family hydrolase n=1 Tax=Pontibacter sp. E15-1 TaxID=2919918 RepID=UPI001F4FA5F4|nr:Cof-type HAD-IIB family hydrolase [Pontibacter sp. E15-1]MCJ8165075.1 Cof-type HAD-IIB family hydrolase [Pontibacter sp. E15-1]